MHWLLNNPRDATRAMLLTKDTRLYIAETRRCVLSLLSSSNHLEALAVTRHTYRYICACVCACHEIYISIYIR